MWTFKLYPMTLHSKHKYWNKLKWQKKIHLILSVSNLDRIALSNSECNLGWLLHILSLSYVPLLLTPDFSAMMNTPNFVPWLINMMIVQWPNWSLVFIQKSYCYHYPRAKWYDSVSAEHNTVLWSKSWLVCNINWIIILNGKHFPF